MAARSMFREMDSDPFFTGYRDHFQQMESMLDRPFGRLGIEDGRGRRDEGGRRRGDERSSGQELAPFGDFGFGGMFENMNRMMRDMEKSFTSAHSEGNGQSFSQASFYSYSKDGKDGQPRVYQASKSTRTGPGGVRETRKALKDSHKDMEKMAIGHHIQDRGHEVERHKNTRTGQMEEFQNFHRIGQDEAEAFDREWQEKTTHAFRGMEYGNGRSGDYGRQRDDRRAVREPRGPPRQDMKALPAPPSEHWGATSESGRRRREKY